MRELLDEVEPTDLDRVLADGAGQRVHRALDRVGRLGTAGAAVGVGRRRVREDAGALEPVGGDVVGAVVDPGAEQRDPRRDELEVRAHRRGELDAHAGDPALLGRGELDLLDHVAAVDRRVEALGALLDPLDRAAEPPGEQQRERLLGVDVQLRAEAAADVGRDHAQLRLGHPEHAGERHAEDVRHLRRRPERQLARRVDRLREHAARLDRRRDQPLLAVALAHGHLGVREGAARRRRPRAARRSTCSTAGCRGRAAHRRRAPWRRRPPPGSGSHSTSISSAASSASARLSATTTATASPS